MKILLDECVPWPLTRYLSEHQCQSPVQCGWGGIKNGELLRLAEVQYDLFITSDKNLRYQQHIEGRRLMILELSTNDWKRIQKNAGEIVRKIQTLRIGDFASHEVP